MSLNGHPATVESTVPGRIRVRLPRHERREDVLDEIKAILQDVDGIRRIQANLNTGSVLIEHDPEVVGSEDLLDVAKAAELIFEPGEELPHILEEVRWPREVSLAAHSIMKSFRKFDRGVSSLTGGRIDGKMLIILFLLLLGIKRLLANGKRPGAPWHALFWYAYSMFVQWHHPSHSVAHRVV